MWFGGYGYGDDGRVDRGSWAQKSGAASKRENQAKQKLDAWIQSCASATTFPLEEPKLVPCSIHLTNPCWLTFRKYAISKGVQVGRKEATPEERAASGDKRKGKMYTIWAKLPVHPSKAVALAESKEKDSKAASIKRKEREQKKKEEEERLRVAKRQRIIGAYETILQKEQSSPSISSNAAPAKPATHSAGAAASMDSSVSAPSPQEILNYAEEAYKEQLRNIRTSILQQKRTLEKQLDQKQKAMEKEALELSKRVKASILSSMPSEKECGLCKKKCKLLVGQCYQHCEMQICADCLAHKIKHDHKCYLCVKAWLGKQKHVPGVAIDESSLHPKQSQPLAQFVCPAGGEPYDWYTHCCESRVCDEHTNSDCCVCNGGRRLCVECGCGTCSRCGRSLCDRCSYKEGCMCQGMSLRDRDWW